MNGTDTYSERVVRHFDAPANVGPLDGDPATVFAGEAGEREHGTRLRFEARIEAERIAEIAFQAYGCPHTIAACSLATERLKGRPAGALARFDIDDLAQTLQVPIDKTARMLLVEDALHRCFRDWENRRLAGS